MGDITSAPVNAAPLLGALRANKIAAYSGSVLDVVLFDADGYCIASNSDDAATGMGWGIVCSTHDGELTFVSGDAITIVTLGPIAGFSGMVEGALHYTSTNDGKLATTAGTVVWRMGYALESNIFFVLPGIAAPTSS